MPDFVSTLGPNSVQYDKAGAAWATNPATGGREAVQYLQNVIPADPAWAADIGPTLDQKFGFASDFDKAGLKGYGQLTLGGTGEEGEFGDWLIPLVGMAGMGMGALGMAGFGPLAGGFSGATGTIGGGLDALGTMINAVPEGMTASEYAAALGFSSADEMLAAMTPIGAGTVGYGAGASSGGGASQGEEAMLQAAREQQIGALQRAGVNLNPTLGEAFSGLLSGTSGFGDLVSAARGLFNPAVGGGLGSVGSIYNIGSGIWGLLESQRQKKQLEEIARMADPFAKYRGAYGDQLAQLMANPSLIQNYPGYKAGLQAVERRMAAQGYNGSGNMMTALADYGGRFFDDAVARLGGFAGAGVNPGGAAQLVAQGTMGSNSMAMNALDRMGYWITSRRPTDIIGQILGRA